MKPSFFPAISSLLATPAVSAAGLSLENYVDSVTISHSFNPIIDSYWTGYPHHRRTPFAVSPDGSIGYLAYLDSSGEDVHVQPVDPTTFEATGTEITVSGGQEASGLVAHDDGFALLTNEALPSGTENAPSDSTPVPVIYRFGADEVQTFKTFLGGPGVSEDFGLVASPDLNGDLVFSEEEGHYAAYFVLTAYTGDASGHYGDAIRYVDASTGVIVSIDGASSDWGCSHNTGIAFEAADSAPFASICAEDQGAIWLNTEGQGMSTAGMKISNENTTNGGSGEPMGGMGGSYSALARFGDSGDEYIFAWVSRGAIDLTENEWMGDGYTNVQNRTSPRNVAKVTFSDKYTLIGDQAISEVGAEDGDSQVSWVTSGSNDCSNAHVASFGTDTALITWEEIEDPVCDFVAMGCRGTFAGSYFQVVASGGITVGDAVASTDTYVAGDMVTVSDGRICWPYVDMTWTLDAYVANPEMATKLSFACALVGDSAASSGTTSSAAASSTVTSSFTTKSSRSEVTPSVVATSETIEESSTSDAVTSEAVETSEATIEPSIDTSSMAVTTSEAGTTEKPVASNTTTTVEPEASSEVEYETTSPSTTAAPTPSFISSFISEIAPEPTASAYESEHSIWPTEWASASFSISARKTKKCSHTVPTEVPAEYYGQGHHF
ncbi:hypothetical protein MKZ38_006683 [Zalerion maritima]|uniref:Uncharacterized protein n=1 Tax=Zalerion maritima TaxID=339359 RepID=A0AAD5WVT4_9PEZI|nr:hypothetical protein MKZ38_006683 [Zalerion maritima]